MASVPVIKPLDAATVTDAAGAAKVVVTAENHTVIGGLGSAVAEALAEAGLGRPLRRVGLRDTFAEGARTGPYLFGKYGLSIQAIVDAAWTALGRRGRASALRPVPADGGRVLARIARRPAGIQEPRTNARTNSSTGVSREHRDRYLARGQRYAPT